MPTALFVTHILKEFFIYSISDFRRVIVSPKILSYTGKMLFLVSYNCTKKKRVIKKLNLYFVFCFFFSKKSIHVNVEKSIPL